MSYPHPLAYTYSHTCLLIRDNPHDAHSVTEFRRAYYLFRVHVERLGDITHIETEAEKARLLLMANALCDYKKEFLGSQEECTDNSPIAI
jgi:hypothetical protein